MTSKGDRLSFKGHENALKLDRVLCAQTILETTEIGHVNGVDGMLCELSQENSFKIKVVPELKHLLKHSTFPCSGRGGQEAPRGGGGRRAGEGPVQLAVRLKEDRMESQESQEPQQPCLPRGERALGVGHAGKRTQNN